MWQKPANRASTAAIFSFLAVSLFGWYAIRPTVQTILFLRREIADKTRVNQQMEDKITSLIEAQATYEAAQPQIPLVEEAIPTIPDAAALIIQLRNLAVLSGASISAMQVPSVPLLGEASASAAKKTQGEFSLTVAITGPYETIKTFLDGLLSMRRIVTMDMIDIQPQKAEKSAQEVLQLLLKIKAYYASRT